MEVHTVADENTTPKKKAPETVTLVSTKKTTLYVCEPPLEIKVGENPGIPKAIAELLLKDVVTVRETMDGKPIRQGCGTFLTLKA